MRGNAADESFNKPSRFIIIGKIERRFWSAIFTYGNDSVRIIFVRRSRREEVKLNESERLG